MHTLSIGGAILIFTMSSLLLGRTCMDHQNTIICYNNPIFTFASLAFGRTYFCNNLNKSALISGISIIRRNLTSLQLQSKTTWVVWSRCRLSVKQMIRHLKSFFVSQRGVLNLFFPEKGLWVFFLDFLCPPPQIIHGCPLRLPYVRTCWKHSLVKGIVSDNGCTALKVTYIGYGI